jgi:hypothetical protein
MFRDNDKTVLYNGIFIALSSQFKYYQLLFL